jgi:hypothetical protein
MENWKPVLGYETLYEVSDLGNVRRIARGKRFTAEQVIEAKKMLEVGAKLADVATFLNTSITSVFSIKHGKTWVGDETSRPLKPALVKHYPTVCLCKEGVYARRSVHRLVWEAFNGNIPGRLEVNHKDLDRANNRLENLELLTHRENVNHAHAIYADERTHLPKGSRHGARSKYAKLKHT